MRNLIISDVHLGAVGRLPEADEKLCRLLNKDCWDRIILLGDIFDLWLSPFTEIKEKHESVMRALKFLRCPIIYVPGNHDDVFQGITKLDNFVVEWPYYRFKSGDKWIVVAHGDKYDEIRGLTSKIGAWIGKIADTISSWLFGAGVSVQRYVRHSYAEIGPGRENYVRPILERAAADLDGDIVIIGHTHVPVHPVLLNGKIIVNSGDFGPEHMNYVVVEEGKTELCTIQSKDN